jgi:hypothetical protein
VSEFTISVLPPKTWGEKMNEAWSGFGSALGGFGGLIATTLTVGGTLGGWLLRSKYKHNEGKNKT